MIMLYIFGTFVSNSYIVTLGCLTKVYQEINIRKWLIHKQLHFAKKLDFSIALSSQSSMFS